MIFIAIFLGKKYYIIFFSLCVWFYYTFISLMVLLIRFISFWLQLASKLTQKKSTKKLLPKKSSIFSHSRGIRKDRQSPVYRVRFEAVRKRSHNPITLHGNPAFLKVPSHKDIEFILSSKMHSKGDKTPSSSDSGSQTKELQQQQDPLYTVCKLYYFILILFYAIFS